MTGSGHEVLVNPTAQRIKTTIPAGWNYNPSEWPQRIPILVLAVIGFLIAAYLALYQYGVVPTVFEPFFGRGSERILHSDLSFLLPVSDAALGAFGYLLDAVTGVIGGTNRWRRMPWIVVIFAIFVGPLGLVSVLLVMAQPIWYDAWCTLCLVTAVISIVMIGPAMDEALASLQYLRRVRERGRRSFWRVFWGLEEDEDDNYGIEQPPQRRFLWNLCLSAVLGIWLMASPEVLGFAETAADDHARFIGPLIITFAICALWDVLRGLRWMNVLLGIWLIGGPWLAGYEWISLMNAMVCGILLIAFSMVPTPVVHRMEKGWKLNATSQ